MCLEKATLERKQTSSRTKLLSSNLSAGEQQVISVRVSDHVFS